MAAPTANAAHVPANVATWKTPNGVSTPTGPRCVPGAWLRNSGHQNG